MNRVRRIPLYSVAQAQSNVAQASIKAFRVTKKQLFLWVVANGCGHLLSLLIMMGLTLVMGFWFSLISFGFADNSSASFILTLIPIAVFGLLNGTLVGVAQGLVLRHYTRADLLEEWVLISALGGMCAWVAGFLAVLALLTTYVCAAGVLFVPGIVAGTFVGVLQRRILARRIEATIPWVGVTIVAGVISFISASFLAALLRSWNGIVGFIVMVFVGGLVYGLITAGAFGRVLQRAMYRTVAVS